MQKEKNINRKMLIMIAIQMVLLILWMPGLEYPDAGVHFYKIHNNIRGELYFRLLGLVSGVIDKISDIEVVLSPNEKFTLFFWQPLWKHYNYNYISVMMYQGCNILLVIGSIWLFQKLIKSDPFLNKKEKNWLIRLDLLYFLLPATAYLVVGITPDMIVYLFQPFFIYLLYRNKYFLAALISIILYVTADKSGIICMLFVGIMSGVKLLDRLQSKNKKIFLLFLIAIVGIPLLLFVRLYINEVESNNFIIQVMQKSIRDNGRLFTKYVNFFLGSFCFWGSGSYITFPLLYVFYGWLLFKVYRKAISDKKNSMNGRFFLSASGMILGMIIVFPPYSAIRYYMFFPLIVVAAVYEYILNDKYLQSDKTLEIISSLLFIHNILLAGLIGIYTFIIM